MKLLEKLNKKFLIAILLIGIITFLFYREEIKITVLNSFESTYAFTTTSPETTSAVEALEQSSEANLIGKVILVSSDWCSMCDPISRRIQEILLESDGVYGFEKINIDTHREDLKKYGEIGVRDVIIIRDEQHLIIRNASLSDIDQLLSSEI